VVETMSYTVLARKYRPQRFSEVIGQDHVTRTLKNAIEQQRIAHGYIFSGHRGIGKTTVARILAAALNCQSADHPVSEPCGVCDSCREVREGGSVDVIEIDAATNRGIDEIRELREATRYRPARDRFKIYILDEAHQITDAAFNALLKTLEEPPSHIVFMMATTQPEDIPQTIRSRCQHFSFHAVKFDDIVGQLRSVCEQEGIAADPDALALLAEAGDGSMRDALSIMDQAIAGCGQRLTGDLVRDLAGTVSSDIFEQLMTAVERDSSQDALRLIDKIITEGQSPTHFARQFVRFLRNTVVAKVAGAESPLLQISADERARAGRVAERFSEEDLARFLQILLRTHADLGYKQEQRFHLELGVLKLVHAQRLLPVEQLLSGAAPAHPAAVHAAPAQATVPRPAAPASARHASASPLAADLERRGASPDTAPHQAASASAPPATPPVTASSSPHAPVAATPAGTDDAVRNAVIAAIEAAGLSDLCGMLQRGQWRRSGGEAVVQIPDPPVLVEMALTKEAERVMSQTASQAAGRPMRLRLVGTGARAAGHAAPAPSSQARGRIAEEPVVRRLQEKFGAEVRSVIDYREKS
jgi:DNA polymerase-3 subunit gamma/tau